ncbi:unnamed protein product [Rhizophagus irregularis]|uniref:histidine kinase n=1 Tax=Rhizophagus irregularis TaxID=588596 RepID=A0A2I1FYS1_9GLOM|nr:hypothetical protein RhiirA4_393521 [Rhizophagus irregularis]CAB4429500.1 unnamed protein product [Rhizophagus irregularis]
MDKALTFMSFAGTENISNFSEIPNQYDQIPAADLVESFDWSSTSLGPMDEWENTLKSTVKLCMHSVFPIAIYYGPELVNIYNQMWIPILKMKHPQALGQPFKEVWAEIYDDLEPLFNEVLSTGKGKFEYDRFFFLLRDGYLEETYFSFTFSPIFKDDGSVGGIFNASQETTQRVLSNRRVKTLSELGKRTPGAKSLENACHLVTRTLHEKNKDIPYALIYLIENSTVKSTLQPREAHLIASTFDEDLDYVKCEDGVDEISFVPNKSRRVLPDYLLETKEIIDLMVVPDEINELINDDSNFELSTRTGENFVARKDFLTSWPIHYVAMTGSHITITLKNGSSAVLYPVTTSSGGKSVLTAVIILGINPHRALDKEYMEFLQLIVGQVCISLTHGKSREEERKQAEILADLNRQKIMFFQNISHELRTPITLMLSPLDEVISECSNDSPMHPHLNMIQRNTRRLLKLVNTLLQFSRIEAGRMEAIYYEVNIGLLTLELASNFESMAKSLNLEYRIEIPENFDKMLEKKVFVDLDMYEKIIFNLCSNAFKHTWTGNVTVKLSVKWVENKEVIVLEVSDTGVGIPKEEIPKLFQRFYRIESRQSRSHEGTGIGLALIHELITRHGGGIQCNSELTKGTTFTIWIPTGHEHLPPGRLLFQKDMKEGKGYLGQENKLFDNKQLYLEEGLQWIQNNGPDSNEDAESPIDKMNVDEVEEIDHKGFFTGDLERSYPIEDDPIPLSGTKHVVLLADDNTDMRNYLSGLLKKEFIVHCACDGREALKKLKKLKNPPDLILSDIMMPNMNGFELLKSIRSDISTQLIPVILLSAKAGEEASIEGLDKGADDYLTKPFSARELIARVRVNIKLSYLRRQLFLQQRQQAETKQLLFSISNKIHSGFNLQKTLSTAAEEIHRTLSADRLFITANDQFENGDGIIEAFSAKDKSEKNIKGQCFKFNSEQIRLHSDPVIVEKLIKELEERRLLDEENDIHNIIDNANKAIAIMTNEQNQFFDKTLKDQKDITNEIGISTSTSSSELSKNSKNQSESSNLSDKEDLDTAEIANFYSINVQKYVSLLAVAIKVNQSTWGWLIVHRPPNSVWSDSEKEFLQQISNQISLAITHAKLLEDKLRREAQIEAARAANEAKSQILANTSHELRTPLGAIIGVLSAFEDTALTDDQKDMIQIMTRASDVVLAVVNDILDAAKLEAQKIKLVNRTFDLFDLVEKTIEIFGEKAGNKQIELILDCEPNSLPKDVRSDPERLQQILMNLLSNSIKFTENGKIVLKISMIPYEETEMTSVVQGQEAGKKAKLYVELCDTGIGIDPAFIKDIFKSFSQGDASMTRRQDGTGLGLSICKHLVDINGGEIDVVSELKNGSRFWFTWNVDIPATSISLDSLNDSLNEQTGLALPSAEQYKRVLIIDSVEAARNSLVKLFKDSVDKVDAFNSCEEGVNAVSQMVEKHNEPPYDVVFFNVYKENAELVKNSALQLRSICGQDLSIALLVFWSANGRALGKDLIYQIGGHTAALCKPIMHKRLLDCLRNNDIFKQSDITSPSKHDRGEYSYVKSLADIRVEKYYHQNRSLDTSITNRNENDSMIIGNNQENDQSTDPMVIDEDSTVKKEIKSQVSDTTSSSSTQTGENMVIGVKRNVTDNNPRAQKSRSRKITKSKCILCVEDNPINLRVIQHQLAKLGYPTLSATNGQEAVNVIEAEIANSTPNDESPRISLILMDCAMPEMSGFDASKAIRLFQSPLSKIPIIALTASAVQGTRDRCLESGMNDYLTKPLKIGQLKEMLEKWLGEE